MADGSATPPGPAPEDANEPKKQRRRTQREAHDTDLEWFLTCGDAAMGSRGTLGGTISVLEHGGQSTGAPNTDLYSDQQLGWHRTVVGLVERHRWLSSAWFTLGPEMQHDLIACYTAPPAAFRSDEGFGARDACPRVEDIERNRAIEPGKPTAFHNRRGTESRLGRYAMLALRVCDDPAALLVACQDPGKAKASRVITRALDAARGRAIAAHEAWLDAKEQAGRPRPDGERRAVLERYEPGGATL